MGPARARGGYREQIHTQFPMRMQMPGWGGRRVWCEWETVLNPKKYIIKVLIFLPNMLFNDFKRYKKKGKEGR